MIVQEDRSDSNYEPISSLITLNREEILQITHTSPSSVGQLTPDPGDDFNRAVPYQEDADDEKDENFCGENGESIWDNDIADVTAGVGLALSPPVLTTRMNRDLILQISSSSSDSDEDQQSGHVAIQGPGSSHEIGRLEQSQPVSRQPVPHPRESCNHSRTGLILQISSSSSDSDEDQQSGHVAIQGPGSSHEIGRLEQNQPVSRQPVPHPRESCNHSRTGLILQISSSSSDSDEDQQSGHVAIQGPGSSHEIGCLEQSQPVSRQPVPRDVVYPNTDPQRMSSFLPTRDPLDKISHTNITYQSISASILHHQADYDENSAMTDASQHGHELTPLRAPEYSQFVHASRDSSPPVPLPTGEVSLMGQALLRHPPLSDPTRFSSVEVPLASLISRPQLSREGTALSNHLPLGNPTRFSSVEVPLARLMSRSQVPREGTPLSNHLPLSDPTRFSSVEVPLSRFQPRGKSIPEIKAGLPVTRRYLNLNRVKRKATVEQPDSSDEEPLARKSRRKNQSKTSDDIRVPSRSKRNKKRRQTSVQLDSNMETSPQPQYADDLQQSVPEDENLPNVIPRSDTPSLSEDDPRDWEIEIPSGQITRSLDESNVDSFGIQETEVSVSRFLTLYKRMATGAEPHPMQHRFALTGLSPRGNKRAVITCKAGLDEATLPMLEAHADIDSVKGVLFSGDQWPFKSPVYLTPIPLLSETINGQSRFYIQKDGKDVPIHHFKNCGFAKCGGDIRIRVIFPLMQDHTPGRKNAVMTQADLKKWYFFIQEAMRKVKKVDLRHWPESYEHGLETSRLSNGTLCIAPIEVHKDIIGSLITTIREVVDADYEYQLKFSGFLLYWEIQNKKGGSRAKIRVDGSDYLQILKEKIIPTAFSDVDVDCLVFRNVQADPAIEYSTEEWSLYWRREFHQLLLSHSTGVSLDVAGERVSAFSSGAQYQCDLLCLMRDIAGMHFNTRGNATDNRVYYMQAYHTDKEVTYQSKAWNKQIPFKPSEVINPPKDATTGITGYTSRIKKYLDLHGRKLSSAARLEVTISMDELESFHLPLTRDLLLQAFERIHRRVMPLFRIMKLDAIQYYYSRMHQAHAETLITTQCAGLLAAFAWMLPALHGRPDESPAHRRIAACAAVPTGVLPNSDIRPLFAKGQFLLTEVQLVEEVPRLVRSPAAEDVLAVLGIQDQEKLLGQLRTGTHRAQPNARYGATKNKQVAVFCAGMHSPVEDIKRMVAPWLEGRGLEYLSSNNDLHYTPEYITTNPLPDNTKSDIYIEYLFQCCCRSVLQKPPNRKANPSKGIIRSTYFRGGTQADVDAILSYDHNYWRIPVNGILQDWPEHYRMHGHHPVAGGQGGRTWWDYSFDKFFPKKGAPPEPPSLQGLHQLECRDRWIDLMDAAETHEAELIRTLMKAKFDTLSAFLPAKDKLWNCDEWTTATASKRSGKTKRGVHLVINSHPRDMSFSSGYRTI